MKVGGLLRSSLRKQTILFIGGLVTNIEDKQSKYNLNSLMYNLKFYS